MSSKGFKRIGCQATLSWRNEVAKGEQGSAGGTMSVVALNDIDLEQLLEAKCSMLVMEFLQLALINQSPTGLVIGVCIFPAEIRDVQEESDHGQN